MIETGEKTETKKCPFCAEEIKKESSKCRFCGSIVDTIAIRHAASVKRVYFLLGIIIFIIGISLLNTFYFMDVSVESGSQKIANFSLLTERISGILIALSTIGIGFILLTIGLLIPPIGIPIPLPLLLKGVSLKKKAINFECEKCKSKMSVSHEHAGQKVQCPKCNEEVQIPA